jgi:hypothetical protein
MKVVDANVRIYALNSAAAQQANCAAVAYPAAKD